VIGFKEGLFTSQVFYPSFKVVYKAHLTIVIDRKGYREMGDGYYT
jgi:hypothetical protein